MGYNLSYGFADTKDDELDPEYVEFSHDHHNIKMRECFGTGMFFEYEELINIISDAVEAIGGEDGDFDADYLEIIRVVAIIAAEFRQTDFAFVYIQYC